MSLQWFGIWGMFDAPTPTKKDLSLKTMGLKNLLQYGGSNEFKEFLRNTEREAQIEVVEFWEKCAAAKRQEDIDVIKNGAPAVLEDSLHKNHEFTLKKQMEEWMEIAESDLKEAYDSYCTTLKKK